MRSRPSGPTAAFAGRGGAPAGFAGACMEWTFKERDARACACAEQNRPNGRRKIGKGSVTLAGRLGVLPLLPSAYAKHPAL